MEPTNNSADQKQKQSLRLFIALELPDSVRNDLQKISQRLQKGFQFAGCRMRWSSPEAYHLTLAFLGDQSPEMCERYQRILNGTVQQFSRQRLELRQLGVFPHWGRPNVLWTGVRDRSHELEKLHANLNFRLEQTGYISPEQEFKPHITLARFKSGKGVHIAEKIVIDHLGFKIGPFEVEGLSLIQSHLHPDGARYETLSHHRFQATGD